jgi:hypothetical protein
LANLEFSAIPIRGVGFIFPSVSQKTVKTVKNGKKTEEKRRENRSPAGKGFSPPRSDKNSISKQRCPPGPSNRSVSFIIFYAFVPLSIGKLCQGVLFRVPLLARPAVLRRERRSEPSTGNLPAGSNSAYPRAATKSALPTNRKLPAAVLTANKIIDRRGK